MTQIATQVTPNIITGPRGIQARNVGGAYSANCQQDIIDGDSLQGPLTLLSGTTDAINPHQSGNYMIKTAGVDAITLGLPTAGADDNLSINIWSDTANAHTVTLPSAMFAPGTALKNDLHVSRVSRGRNRVTRDEWNVAGCRGIARDDRCW